MEGHIHWFDPFTPTSHLNFPTLIGYLYPVGRPRDLQSKMTRDVDQLSALQDSKIAEVDSAYLVGEKTDGRDVPSFLGYDLGSLHYTLFKHVNFDFGFVQEEHKINEVLGGILEGLLREKPLDAIQYVADCLEFGVECASQVLSPLLSGIRGHVEKSF